MCCVMFFLLYSLALLNQIVLEIYSYFIEVFVSGIFFPACAILILFKPLIQ